MTRLIEQVLVKFISTKKPEVLAISGAWGVGKTFALHKVIRSSQVTSGFSQYSYVSLFGLHSISELRTKIWTRGQDFPLKDGEDSVFQKINGSSWPGKIWSILSNSHPAAKNVVVGIETVVANLIKETIICFDDLERLGDGIAIDDFMGLVSELKEQCRCKIIIVFNEEQLNQNAALFKKYSEKVIDQKLLFVIDPLSAAQIGLSNDVPLRDILIGYIEALRIQNIRVIQKISTSLEYIYPLVESHSDEIKNQVVCSVAVFSASLYEGGRGFPTTDKLIKYNRFKEMMEDHQGAVDGAAGDQNLLDWKMMLERCNFSSVDELDLEILKALEQGYPDGTEIKKYADDFDAVHERAKLDRIFSSVWDKFHYRFDLTGEELAGEFEDAVSKTARIISPGNLNSTVGLLRALGLNESADRIIDIYILANVDNTHKFDPRNYMIFDDHLDETLLRHMSAARANNVVQMPLQDAAQLIIDNIKWDDAAGDALAAATPQQLVTLFKNNQGPHLSTLIKGVQNLPYDVAKQQLVRDNTFAALALIANESPLNELRVKRFGLDIAARRAGVR